MTAAGVVSVRARDEETVGRRSHRVEVAHPHDPLDRLLAAQQARRTVDVQRGAAVLAAPGLRDLAAEITRDELRAVTDAEHRNAGVVDRGIDRRRAVDVHRRGTAREDDRLRACARASPRPASSATRSRYRRAPRARAARSAARTAHRSRQRERDRADRVRSRRQERVIGPCRRPANAGATCPRSAATGRP